MEVKDFCREIRPARDFGALQQLRQLAREIRPDLIHLHSSKAGALGRLAWSGRKTPLLYTPHGYSFLMADCSPCGGRCTAPSRQSAAGGGVPPSAAGRGSTGRASGWPGGRPGFPTASTWRS